MPSPSIPNFCKVLLLLFRLLKCNGSPTAAKDKATPTAVVYLSLYRALRHSPGADLEMKEGVVVQLKDESRSNGMIENVGINGFDFETEFEFWPIQHPTEPSHEDRPVQCPMSPSSPLINDERMQDDRFSERKRPEASIVSHKENSLLQATEPPVRTVRKRHHDHTNTITPLLQKLPVSHQNMNTNVLNKLQQVHRFES